MQKETSHSALTISEIFKEGSRVVHIFFLHFLPHLSSQALDVPIYEGNMIQRKNDIGKKSQNHSKIWNCNSIFTPWNYTFLFMRVNETEKRKKILWTKICLIIERGTSLDNRPTCDFLSVYSIERWIFKSPSCWICKLKFEKWKLLSVLTMEFD